MYPLKGVRISLITPTTGTRGEGKLKLESRREKKLAPDIKEGVTTKILAIDPATRSGFAWASGPEDFSADQCTVLNFKPKKGEADGARYLKLWAALERMAPAEVVYEQVGRAHRGMRANLIYGGLIGTIEAYCAQAGVKATPAPATQVKKHATGKGTADKRAMVKAAREQLSYAGEDEDEVDALWILRWYLETHKKLPAFFD